MLTGIIGVIGLEQVLIQMRLMIIISMIIMLAKRKKMHNKQVGFVRAVIDTAPPKSFSVRPVNAKKIKMQEDRLAQIEKANSHLVDKMLEILHSSGTIDSHNEHGVPVSLNLRPRAEELKRIEKDNLMIMKRINAAKGSYSKEFPEDTLTPRVKKSPRAGVGSISKGRGNNNNDPSSPKRPMAVKPSGASAYNSRSGRKTYQPLYVQLASERGLPSERAGLRALHDKENEERSDDL